MLGGARLCVRPGTNSNVWLTVTQVLRQKLTDFYRSNTLNDLYAGLAQLFQTLTVVSWIRVNECNNYLLDSMSNQCFRT